MPPRIWSSEWFSSTTTRTLVKGSLPAFSTCGTTRGDAPPLEVSVVFWHPARAIVVRSATNAEVSRWGGSLMASLLSGPETSQFANYAQAPELGQDTGGQGAALSIATVASSRVTDLETAWHETNRVSSPRTAWHAHPSMVSWTVSQQWARQHCEHRPTREHYLELVGRDGAPQSTEEISQR